jgi:hypothetical protein
MGLFTLIRHLLGKRQQESENLAGRTPETVRNQAWYIPREISAPQLQALIDELIDPLRSLIAEVRIRLVTDQIFCFDVLLRSGLSWFDFSLKCRLGDVWHDRWTSTVDMEILSVASSRFSNILPDSMQRFAGKWFIRLLDFSGPLLRRDKRSGAVIRVQANTLHVNIRPWVEAYFRSAASSDWLERFFGSSGQTNRGQRIADRTVIFGAHVTETGQVSLLIYRLSARVKKLPPETRREVSGAILLGGIFEWIVSLATSLILVSLLVPFALAYLHLEPVHFNDLFSLPKILTYNIAIVLVPFWILRMTMMPVRHMWSRRQGQVEVLRAEVERDRIFLPLLRNWVLQIRRMEMSGHDVSLQSRVQEWILRIGEQRRLLQQKLREIEKQRRLSMGVLITGYVAVSILEYALWQGYLAAPGVYAEKIHSLLAGFLLGK